MDLRPHWIALIMPAIATIATLAAMLVLYNVFEEPILDTVVGDRWDAVPPRVSRPQAGGLAHVALRRDERSHHPSAWLHREVLDGGPPRSDQRRSVRAGDRRPHHRRGDARRTVGVRSGPAGVRSHPQARRGAEDDLSPGGAEPATDGERDGRTGRRTRRRRSWSGSPTCGLAASSRKRSSTRRSAGSSAEMPPEGPTDVIGAIGEIDHVYYWTRDMERAVTFYGAVLGLRISRRAGDEWAEFDAGPVRLALHGTEDASIPASGTIVFRVDDLDAAEMGSAATRRGVRRTRVGGSRRSLDSPRSTIPTATPCS